MGLICVILVNNILFIYTIFRREKHFSKSKMTKMTLTKMTHFVSFTINKPEKKAVI